MRRLTMDVASGNLWLDLDNQPIVHYKHRAPVHTDQPHPKPYCWGTKEVLGLGWKDQATQVPSIHKHHPPGVDCPSNPTWVSTGRASRRSMVGGSLGARVAP